MEKRHISIRRPNCNYRSHITWTNKLNQGLYNLYIKSEPKKKHKYQKCSRSK